MPRKLNHTEEALLCLVRQSIGNEPTCSLDLDEGEWETVYELAIEQGVVGVSFIVVQDLAFEGDTDVLSMIVPEMTYYSWLASTLQINELYDQHENAISELAQFYGRNGIDMVLLKGYGLSINYPQPNMRPSGDIDIWLKGKQYEADSFMEEQTKIVPEKSSHHTIFKWKDCEVENHMTILEYDTHKSNIKLDKELTLLANIGGETIDVLGHDVILPSVDFNIRFILRHNALHFAVQNITLRHLLDWAFFVTKNESCINWNEVYRFAEKYQMDVFLNCQNAICVKYLGFPSNSFPVIKPNDTLTNRIIAEILKPEFKEEIPNMRDNFIGYCKTKTKRLWVNRWKSRITNSDSFVSSLFFYSTNRIKESLSKRY